jgi:hypothetical protein
MKTIRPFQIPSFAKTIFVSKAAKDRWGAELSAMQSFVSILEIESVKAGLRPCTWQTISETTYPQYAAEWAQSGLSSLPVKRVRQFQGFSHQHEDPVPGEAANVCVIVGKRPADLLEFKAAIERGDNDVQGELLGYPACCRQFFVDVWRDGYYDPIWRAGIRSGGEMTDNKMRVKGNRFSTPILRYVGARTSFHIPCRFDCDETIKRGGELMALAETIDEKKAKTLQSFQTMNHSWDVLHGIAVVRTPIFYCVVNSIPTTKRHVVEVEFDQPFYPEYSAVSEAFPFQGWEAKC